MGAAEEDQAGYLMTYGPDWPPKPPPPAPPRRRRRRLSLASWCVIVVAGYTIVWALGAAVLEIRTEMRTADLGGTPAVRVTGPAPSPAAHTAPRRR